MLSCLPFSANELYFCFRFCFQVSLQFIRVFTHWFGQRLLRVSWVTGTALGTGGSAISMHNKMIFHSVPTKAAETHPLLREKQHRRATKHTNYALAKALREHLSSPGLVPDTSLKQERRDFCCRHKPPISKRAEGKMVATQF